MYKINDVVMYKNTGVCKITDITSEKFTGVEMDYYVLKPLYNGSSTIYCPVGTDDKLRKTITKEVIDKILNKSDFEKIEWIENKNMRLTEYSKIIKEGDPEKLVALLKYFHTLKEDKIKNGKKLNISDERLMTDAKKLIDQEFAYVIDIEPDEVKDYILDLINK